MATKMITPVILAGGKGTRLWPVSREDIPKQFCKLSEGQSLFQNTIERIRNADLFNPAIIITGCDHVAIVRQQLKEISFDAAVIISEPEGKDTSAAVLLAIEVAKSDDLFLVMPSDHLIADEENFFSAVEDASISARLEGLIVTFGIKPTHPDTGFGYLRAGNSIGNSPVCHLQNFVEKPDIETAKELIKQPNVFWNAGIFLFNPKVVRAEFAKRASDIFSAVTLATHFGTWTDQVFSPYAKVFSSCPAISFDYSIMEKTKLAATIAVDPQWSDLGSWKAVWELSPRDDKNNAIGRNCFAENASDCLIRSDGPVVGVAGVDDIVAVASKDAILITSRSNPQDTKRLVQTMKSEAVSAATAHPGEDRPWGRLDSLDRGEAHQIRRIRVDPGQSLSLQFHHHRAEHWVVVAGGATATVDDDVIDVTVGDQIFIPKGAVHRLENFTKETVEIIEIQIGDYLDEDDIFRVDDVYGRKAIPKPKLKRSA